MSSHLDSVLSVLRATGEGAFMPFLVVGDPDLDSTVRLADVLVDSGADILEFGFPFSDPPADGPVIQAADERALRAGTTPAAAFGVIARVRARHRQPIVLLMYYNLILQFGVEAFYRRAAEVGVDGVLVADLPLELGQEAARIAMQVGIAPIHIVTALTPDERARRLSEASRGFLYLVARLGITGERAEISDSLRPAVGRLKRVTQLPVLAGFGISTPAHVRSVLEAGADGAITGSALVRRVEEHLQDRAAMDRAVGGLARSLKEATRR